MAYTAKSDGAWINGSDPGGSVASNLIDAGDCNRWEANQLDAHNRITTLEGVTPTAGGSIVSGFIPSGSLTPSVVHSLGTRDLLVGVLETAPNLFVQTAAVATDVNTVQFTFATAPTVNQYRYIIAAQGVTLAAPQVRDPAVVQPYATSLTINAAAGNNRIVTATGNLTLNDPSNGQDGQMLRLRVIASGAQRVVTFAGTLKRPSSIASTLTIGSGLRGDVGLYYESAYGWTVLAAQVA